MGVIKSVGRKVGTARCAVTADVQRAERTGEDVRTSLRVAPLNAARTAQRAVPTTHRVVPDRLIAPVVSYLRCVGIDFRTEIAQADQRFGLARVLEPDAIEGSIFRAVILVFG